MYQYKHNSIVATRGPRHPDIVDRDIDSLTFHEKRNWSGVAEQRLTDLVWGEGIIIPILLWGNACVHTGFHRLMAAKRIGLKTVPCIHKVSLRDLQQQGFIDADKSEEIGCREFPDSIRQFDARGPLLIL